jgi:uncharacterized protein
MRARVVSGLMILVLLFAGSALFLWGLIVEPRVIDEQRERAVVRGLPQGWEGKTIAVIGDIQLGMWLNNTGTAQRIVARLVRAKPALVLIAGDFVYHPTEDDSRAEALDELDIEEQREIRRLLDAAARLVAPLPAANIPTYAVLGNHDYAMESESALALPWVADALEHALEGAGVQVLRNEAVQLQAADRQNSPLYLVGIDAACPGASDVPKALAMVPTSAPRLALMHNPNSFRSFPPGTAPFAVAGHTHGGQIRVPLLPLWSWLEIVRDGDIHADGWIEPAYGAAGNRLYVNRGIGFSLVPVRLNCPPEITFFTLTASDA